MLHPDDYGLAVRLTNLAGVYRDQQRFEEAGPLYKRSLEIAEKAFGPDSVRVIDHLNDLAGVYKAQKRYGDAEPLLKQLIAISRRPSDQTIPRLAPRWPILPFSIGSKAGGDSEPIFKRALAIAEKSPGLIPEGSNLLHSSPCSTLSKSATQKRSLLQRSIAIAESILA